MTTTARQPKTPVARTCRIDGDLLTLTVGTKTNTYRVELLPADFGVGIRLRKRECAHAGGPQVDLAVYDVDLDPAAGHHFCSCPGATYHNVECKHIAACLALLEAGRLLSALDNRRDEALPALLARVLAVTDEGTNP